MTNSDDAQAPEVFRSAVDAMHDATVRSDISMGSIRPPQRLAPYSHAVGFEVQRPQLSDALIPEQTEGDAFGRLILLYDPKGDEAWNGTMRLVAYIQADVDAVLAEDPMLPEVAWQWLGESLDLGEAKHHSLGGAVTATSSVRFGEISGPGRAHQLELRASWTADDTALAGHVEAFARVLGLAAGLPPEGVAQLGTA